MCRPSGTRHLKLRVSSAEREKVGVIGRAKEPECVKGELYYQSGGFSEFSFQKISHFSCCCHVWSLEKLLMLTMPSVDPLIHFASLIVEWLRSYHRKSVYTPFDGRDGSRAQHHFTRSPFARAFYTSGMCICPRKRIFTVVEWLPIVSWLR